MQFKARLEKVSFMDYRERIITARCQTLSWLSRLALAALLVNVVSGRPAQAFDAAKLAEIDAAITNAIAERKLPGGVLWLERKGQSYVNAYGQRAVEPETEVMTEDTMFDAASLTKVVATAPAIMLLVERGTVNLSDTVRRWIPDFRGERTEGITVHHLLTHTSGLPSGLSADPPWSGYYTAIEKACQVSAQTPPGTAFRYSDINFILLGEIVRRASGRKLSEFTETEIFEPLGMTDTGYLPTKLKQLRIAPTEVTSQGVLRGIVHDPTARRMGGVAGHAGLFTTARDLARYARMMLNRGELEGVRLFKPATVVLMTMVQTPATMETKRGLGWDIDSPYAGPRGDLFPVGSYGHTGWTGTSLWIDPSSGTFLIFLSNRNHPSEAGSVVELRRILGTLAAEAAQKLDDPPAPVDPPPAPIAPPPAKPEPQDLPTELEENVEAEEPDEAVKEVKVEERLLDEGIPKIHVAYTPPVLNGIDVLAKRDYAPLKDLRLGLITNHTGTDHQRRRTIDLLHEAEGVDLRVLFSPEHGLRGALDAQVPDGEDASTGLPVFSLYGERRAPTAEQLRDLDALVFDIQDIGCRFYTYISTMGLCMEAAAQAGLKFFVLDRVNPINGVTVEGPVYQGESEFVAFHALPLRHGMTVGELAAMFAEERGWELDLTVIPVEGWFRGMWFDQTGLPWTNPSPNMRNLKEAILYPGIGLLETAVSVGRGTDLPFELVGAPYIDDTELAADLNAQAISGVRFVAVRFTPDASVFAGQECGGVYVLLTDRNHCPVVDVGLAIGLALQRAYPEEFAVDKFNRLLLDSASLERIRGNGNLREIKREWQAGLEGFMERRSKFLIYN